LGTKTNQVRLRYSGFIVFTTQILSLITGLVFTLLLTRNMTTDQFNIWTNIFDYTGYFLLFNPVLPFWATRFVARGKEGAVKTSVSTQLTIALASTAVYFPVIVLISNAIGTSNYLPIYIIAGFYILTFYSITIFESILQCVKPQFVGYGLIVEESVKVIIALVLILGFKQLFLGAILGLVVSCVVQVFFYLYILRSYFKQKIHWGYLKEWIKGSPAIAYNAIGGQLMSFVFILLFLYGGSGARAYYQAALTFTVIISYANSLAFALYPKLLAKSCNIQDVGVSFHTVMMLAIPFATITMLMSMSFLTILKVSYAVAWPVLIALTVDTLVVMVSTFYSNCVMGVEHFDAEGKISFRKLMHSKIFKIFTIPYIQAAIAVPLTYFVLNGLPVVNSVMATVEVVVILLAVHTSTLLGLYYFMRHSIKIPVAWRSIAKYIFSALLMGLALYLLPATTTLLSTIAKAVGGFAFYIGLLLLIDHQARELLGLVWEEIKGTLRQLRLKNNGFNDENEVFLTEN
jgi:O-antigen/teichoic acid export membrane protein